MKDIAKKHLITILCVISVILLVLPLAKVTVELNILGTSSSSTQTVTGFNALKGGVFSYVLIVGPALLIAMNYIEQLGKYKGLLAIAVPVLCLVSLVLSIMQCKGVVSAASGAGGGAANIKLSAGIGAILLGITYIGTALAGAVTYHNFTLDKAGLENLKESGMGLLKSAGKSSPTAETAHPAASEGKPAPAAVKKKPVNLDRSTEVLALIEKLSGMKESGILTEEEFTEKKNELLKEL